MSICHQLLLQLFLTTCFVRVLVDATLGRFNSDSPHQTGIRSESQAQTASTGLLLHFHGSGPGQTSNVELYLDRPTRSIRPPQTDRTCKDRVWDKRRTFHESNLKLKICMIMYILAATFGSTLSSTFDPTIS